MEIPLFFQRLCREKQICNAKKEELNLHFPRESEGIPLGEFDCLCVGYRNQIKCVERFRFLKCAKKPLMGSHTILHKGEILKVDSLTFFKKEVLGFGDHVSFDRATFLLLEKEEKVFRLRFLRDRLQLETFSGETTTIKPLEDPLLGGLSLATTLTCPIKFREEVLSIFSGGFEEVTQKVLQTPSPIERTSQKIYLLEILTTLWENILEGVCTKEELKELQNTPTFFISRPYPDNENSWDYFSEFETDDIPLPTTPTGASTYLA